MDVEPISVSQRVFLFGVGCLIVTLIVVCVGLGCALAWREHALLDARRELQDTRDRVAACELQRATIAGRVQSYEAIMVRPQAHAVEALLDEHRRVTARAPEDTTLADFRAWLAGTMGIGGR